MAATDKDVTISWAHPIGTRDGTLTKDAKMVNCFVEKTENGTAIVKRPGTSYASSGNTGTPQGQFAYFGTQYFIINNQAYQSGSSGGGGGLAIPAPSGGTLAYWSVSAEEAGAPSTVIQDEAGQLWTFNGAVFTKVTDANYISTPVAPGIVYLDGVYYAMRVDGQVIGSAINDPTVWPALDFAQADVTYLAGITLLRHLNYVIAFYDQGTQVFWDANAAPNTQGIALLPVLSASFTTGCFNARTVVELRDMSIWVAHSSVFGRTVQMLQGLQMTPISDTFVEKILNQVALTQNSSQMWAFGVEICGHMFYVLTLAELNLTLVYDIVGQSWSTWSTVVNGVEQFFAGRFYFRSEGFGGVFGDTLQDTTTGRQIVLSAATFTDAAFALPTVNIPVACITPNYDWGTLNWKRFTAMFQQADTITTTIGIAYTDDDYQTFSTPRVMSLQFPLKQLRNCGSSRRRAWKMTHSDATPLRLYDVKAPITLANR